MKPEIDQILGTSAMQLMGELAPMLPPGYAQSSAGLLAMLLTYCAQEYENGAEIRAHENAELRNLLAELEASVEDAVRRVLARMTDDLVRRLVVETAERLIREEIEKIKASPE